MAPSVRIPPAWVRTPPPRPYSPSVVCAQSLKAVCARTRAQLRGNTVDWTSADVTIFFAFHWILPGNLCLEIKDRE